MIASHKYNKNSYNIFFTYTYNKIHFTSYSNTPTTGVLLWKLFRIAIFKIQLYLYFLKSLTDQIISTHLTPDINFSHMNLSFH